LLARCLLASDRESLRAAFQPTQSAVAVAGGAEALGRSVQLVLEERPSWVALQGDLENAFGRTKREAALEELHGSAPALARFQRRLWAGPTRFRFDLADGSTAFVDASEGIDQGDPAGPALCCASMAPALRELQAALRALHEDAFVGAFMDDVVLVVPPEHAARAAELAKAAFGARGHAFAADKCRAYSPTAASAAAPPPPFVPSPLGLVIAGVPVGQSAQQLAVDKLAEVSLLLERLRSVRREGAAGYARRFSAFRILAQCLQHKLGFLARVTPPEELRAHAQEFDRLVQRAFLDAFSIAESEPMPSAAQLHLPVARGGCGLVSQEERLTAAFVASAVLVAPSVQAMSGIASMAPEGPDRTARSPGEARLHAAAGELLALGLAE